MATRTAPSQWILLSTVLLLSVPKLISSALTTSKNDEVRLDLPFQDSFEHLPHTPCVTLFHRNGRIGCGSKSRDYETGRLVRLGSDELSDGSISDNIVIVMTDLEFNSENMQAIRKSDFAVYLEGILVTNSSVSNSDGATSPAPPSPRGYNTPSSSLNLDGGNYEWNPSGDSLDIMDLYSIPSVYVSDADLSEYLIKVSAGLDLSGDDNSSGKGGASTMAEFNYYMGPEGENSEGCLSWIDSDGETWNPKCLPLGGNSIWAVAGSPEDNDNNNNNKKKELVMIATSIDGYSMFHDSSPAANAAASNILAALLAAKLIGEISDDTLDASLSKRIAFGFFQGESFGYIGSRAFLRDAYFDKFECQTTDARFLEQEDGDDNAEEQESKAIPFEQGGQSCLYPLRPSMAFSDLGDISLMLAVDQVGVLQTQNTLYVHDANIASQNNDDNDVDCGDDFITNVMTSVMQNNNDDGADNTITVAQSSVEANDDDNGNVPTPPSPLTSLLQLSGGTIGGAVLTGYDQTFNKDGTYGSHLDNANYHGGNLNLDAIAAAATVLARSAVAIAYDLDDCDDGVEFAMETVRSATSQDETLVDLADCLFNDGNCQALKQYSLVERNNEIKRTGIDLGMHYPLGTPPNYYTNIYEPNFGQPFVKVASVVYGAYDGTEYGKTKGDTILMRPKQLEAAIHGMLNDFLGRGSASNNNEEEEEEENQTSCKTSTDCNNASNICQSSGDVAVCAGSNVCVCKRAHYHAALDEAIEAPPINRTRVFQIKDDDEGVSALYTEPYWSNDVGVTVYRQAAGNAGVWTLGIGVVVAVLSVGGTMLLKRRLTKEKLF
mmetsp:Transcript_42431/g.62163  ORF Transcript_42431/g.62163 Transcript_42431/m.62163 type:complete len:832 (+) Transcript_42431:116-2611(+)|eukprot:CAMPEP_0195510896 /NCGR_PEP_ID=MMETSP0794_2-20130614/3398_1 /TAXON_ID=515487 /ORGANISM="Stephanopyxis turris, Strain CCMP 815" /LENGTH=831 /DNA_ID=CAMNT_0040638405 /DNA_START=97 /DNA_END=2592 /DNA_ORIENTATION=+